MIEFRIEKMADRLKRFSAGVLLLILSAYYVNSTMCYHQHVISGETIFHSHFSSSDHASNHEGDGGHTLEAAKLIAVLTQISLEEQNFDNHTAEAEALPLYSVEARYNNSEISPFVGYSRSLRAPPVVG